MTFFYSLGMTHDAMTLSIKLSIYKASKPKKCHVLIYDTFKKYDNLFYFVILPYGNKVAISNTSKNGSDNLDSSAIKKQKKPRIEALCML